MTEKEIFAPYHPGELLKDTLAELGISQYRFAKITGIAPAVLNGICHCKRSISVDAAIRIGRALGTGAQGWLNMQMRYETEIAEAKNGAEFDKIRAISLPESAAA